MMFDIIRKGKTLELRFETELKAPKSIACLFWALEDEETAELWKGEIERSLLSKLRRNRNQAHDQGYKAAGYDALCEMKSKASRSGWKKRKAAKKKKGRGS